MRTQYLLPPRRLAVFALLVAGLVACGESPISPDAPSLSEQTSVVSRSATTADFRSFIDAQGTYCDLDPDGALPCVVLPPGIGFIVGFGLAPDADPYYTADFGGVNRRYYDTNGLTPALPAYAANGNLTETRLPDGRRRLIITFDAHNTLIALYDGFDVALGADFFEYGVEPVVLGSAKGVLDLILPADFVGMPDFAQAVFSPVPGMEVRRFQLSMDATGTLRRDFDGVAAGTRVNVSTFVNWLPMLANRPVRSGRLIMMAYEPSQRITVKPAK